MSATIDGARVAKLLGDAPVIESEGRAFPVETRYLGRDARAPIERQVADAAARALRAEPGSVLAFLPGAGEIRRTETLLQGAHRRSRGRRGRALRRARCRCAGPRHRAVAAGPAQGRAGHVDRRDLADHRRRAHRDRLRPVARAALRARRRPDAARNRAGVARLRRPAPRPRRPHRARRLLPAVGRAADRVARRLQHAGNPRRRPVRPGARSRALGRQRSGQARLPRSAAAARPGRRRARCSTELGAIDGDGRITDEGRALRQLPLPPRSRAWWSMRRRMARRDSPPTSPRC